MNGKLSPREQAILQLLVTGRPNRAISEELGVHVLTVKGCVSRICRKLGAANRAHAVYRALELGVLPPPKVISVPRPAPPPVLRPTDWVAVGRLRASWDFRRVEYGGKRLVLTELNFRVLHWLMRHPGVVLSRDQLIDACWGRDAYICEETVNRHIRILREALEPVGADWMVETVFSVGYRLVDRRSEK